MTTRRTPVGPPPPLPRPGAPQGHTPLQARMIPGARQAVNAPAPHAPARIGAPPLVVPGRGAVTVQLRPAGGNAPAPLRPGPPPLVQGPSTAIQRQTTPNSGSAPVVWKFRTPKRAKIGKPAYNFAGTRSVNKNHFTGAQVKTPGKSDLAATHVVPDAGIKHTLTHTTEMLMGASDPTQHLERIDRLVENTKRRNNLHLALPDQPILTNGSGKKVGKQTFHSHVNKSNTAIETAYNYYLNAVYSNNEDTIEEALTMLHGVLSVNPGNLPDYGIHSTFNQPVSDRLHLNIDTSGRLSPVSNLALDFPLLDTGVAVSQQGNYLITRQGGYFRLKDIEPDTLRRLEEFGLSRTNIPSPRS